MWINWQRNIKFFTAVQFVNHWQYIWWCHCWNNNECLANWSVIFIFNLQLQWGSGLLKFHECFALVVPMGLTNAAMCGQMSPQVALTCEELVTVWARVAVGGRLLVVVQRLGGGILIVTFSTTEMPAKIKAFFSVNVTSWIIKISVRDMNLKVINLRLQLNLPGANGLTEINL